MSAAVSNLVIHCLTNTTAINKPYKIRIFDFHCLIDETAINRSSSTSRLLVWLLPMNIEANLNLFFFLLILRDLSFRVGKRSEKLICGNKKQCRSAAVLNLALVFHCLPNATAPDKMNI